MARRYRNFVVVFVAVVATAFVVSHLNRAHEEKNRLRARLTASQRDTIIAYLQLGDDPVPAGAVVRCLMNDDKDGPRIFARVDVTDPKWSADLLQHLAPNAESKDGSDYCRHYLSAVVKTYRPPWWPAEFSGTICRKSILPEGHRVYCVQQSGDPTSIFVVIGGVRRGGFDPDVRAIMRTKYDRSDTFWSFPSQGGSWYEGRFPD